MIIVVVCYGMAVLLDRYDMVFTPIVPLEEAIAYSNIPVCGYIYRVSNREKRISAVMYASNEVKCKRDIVGRVNFYFDREGRITKIDCGDGVYEIRYEPALELPYRKIECQRSDVADGSKWINTFGYDKGWNSPFYLFLRLWPKNMDGIWERWIKIGKDSVDIIQYKYYRIKKGKMVSGAVDGKNWKKRGGMEYFYGEKNFALQKIEDTLYTSSLDYCETSILYYDCDCEYWYEMEEGRVYMSYYKNRKLDCEYSCDLEKTLSPDRWEYCVVRTEYSDIFYSNLARIWYPTRDYMIVEYHVEEYWNGPNGI